MHVRKLFGNLLCAIFLLTAMAEHAAQSGSDVTSPFHTYMAYKMQAGICHYT